MNKIDNRFDQKLLNDLIGKTLEMIKYDHFKYTNSVTGIVGVMINKESYAIINNFETVDYLGWDTEACVCKIIKKPWNEICSYVENEKQIIIKINETIKNIIIVNDHIESFCKNEQDYDIWETRAIIFDLSSYQLSFAKQACFFSMGIEINKGYNLINKIETINNFYDESEYSKDQRLKINREIIKIIN